MKRFAGFFKKELIHILRDPRTLIILFGMPFVQILLFGYAITNEVKNARIAILDNSKDEVSFKLIDKILSSGYFTMSEYLQTSAEIDHAFKQGEVKLAVVIPERLSEKLKRNELVQIQLISDAKTYDLF
jgi:ABC-2 type transport system permease protein